MCGHGAKLKENPTLTHTFFLAGHLRTSWVPLHILPPFLYHSNILGTNSRTFILLLVGVFKDFYEYASMLKCLDSVQRFLFLKIAQSLNPLQHPKQEWLF